MATPDKIGRYEVNAELGRGGMATVFHARDPRFGRDVAIKVLPRQFLHDPQFLERFNIEAQTIAKLEHSAIVPVYDFGEQSDQPYLVMRYMSGGSLTDRMDEGAMPVADAAPIIRRVAAALDEAHRRGIIHRDLKPANILFDRNGEAYLSDFGIAKLTESTAALTGSAIIGTPAYMSPEQARGDAGIDGRSDVYALGVILFEMLTAQPPYEADTPMGLAVKHIVEPVPSILDVQPDLHPALEAIIARALAKNPEHRFQRATDMADALEACARGDEVNITPPPEEPLPTPATVTLPPAPIMDTSTGLVSDASGTASVMEAAEELRTAAHNLGEAVKTKAEPAIRSAAAEAAERNQQRRTDKEARRAERRANRNPGKFMLGCLAFVAIAGVGTLLVFNQLSKIPKAILDANVQVEDAADSFSHPLGEADEAEITLSMSGADVNVYALGDDASEVVNGDYDLNRAVDVKFRERSGAAIFTMDQVKNADAAAFLDAEAAGTVNLGLTPLLPLDLTVEAAHGALTLDLSALNVESLVASGGTGSTNLVLPATGSMNADVSGGLGGISIRPANAESDLELRALQINGGVGTIRLELPLGDADVRIFAGVGDITIIIPEGLAAEINAKGEGSSVTMFNDRFEAVGGSRWRTDDFEDAPHQATIEIETGLGNITVTD